MKQPKRERPVAAHMLEEDDKHFATREQPHLAAPYPVTDVDNVLLVFPANVLHLMPRMEDIPEEFKSRGTKWNQLFTDWFYFGLTELKLVPKPGIDEKRALRHIHVIMRSFEPKQEHKTAAVAFLLSTWFADATWEAKERP